MVEINNITKKFDGITVLDDLSFCADDCSIYGLVGCNGAGKTTLLKVIAGVYRQDSGIVKINGINTLENPRIKEEMFYVPDDLYFRLGATMNSTAKFYKSYYSDFSTETFKKLSELFGLDTKKRLFGFSKGMQRQAEIVLALSCMPKVILLDECFDGLDPAKRTLTRKLLLDYMAEKECTIIISSHNLNELADMCDRISLIDGNKIALSCAVDDINGTRCKFRLVFGEDKSREDFNGIHGIKNFAKDGKIITFTVSGEVEQAQKTISAMNPVSVEEIPLTLEEIFLEEMEGTTYDFNKIFS